MILFPDPNVVQLSPNVVQIDDALIGVAMDGVEWYFDDLDGWALGGGVESNFAPRPNAHGSFDAPVYRRARVITLSGVAVADSLDLAEEAAEALAATLADGRMGTMTVSSANRDRRVNVRLSDTPQAAWLGDRAFRWSLQFTAPDWRKYGTDSILSTSLRNAAGAGLVFPISGGVFNFNTDTVTGSLSFTNSGTAPTEPVLTVSGPLAAGFEVTYAETGQRLRYEAPVGGDIVLDCKEGRVSTEGQDRSTYLTIREWFSVPPKTTATFRFSTLGTETSTDPAALKAVVAPAYH